MARTKTAGHRARATKTRKLQSNLNALQVMAITFPISLEALNVLIELTDAAIRVVGLDQGEEVVSSRKAAVG